MLMQAGWVVFSSVVLMCILFGVLGLWIRNVEDKTGYILRDIAGVREQLREMDVQAIGFEDYSYKYEAYEFQTQLDELKQRLNCVEVSYNLDMAQIEEIIKGLQQVVEAVQPDPIDV